MSDMMLPGAVCDAHGLMGGLKAEMIDYLRGVSGFRGNPGGSGCTRSSPKPGSSPNLPALGASGRARAPLRAQAPPLGGAGLTRTSGSPTRGNTAPDGSCRSGEAAVADPPDAEPGQGEGEGEEDRGLVAL